MIICNKYFLNILTKHPLLQYNSPLIDGTGSACCMCYYIPCSFDASCSDKLALSDEFYCMFALYVCLEYFFRIHYIFLFHADFIIFMFFWRVFEYCAGINKHLQTRSILQNVGHGIKKTKMENGKCEKNNQCMQI